MRKKQYISIDVEASGPIPGEHSMLSLGACVVRNQSLTFYSEFKPISPCYSLAAMKVASLGLKCIEGSTDNELNPNSTEFSPMSVLESLAWKGAEPKEGMQKFREWIGEVCGSKLPVLCGSPIVFDGMYVKWYMHRYLDEDINGYDTEDIRSMYRGQTGNRDAQLWQIGLRKGKMSHNALEDAIQQAKEFHHVLCRMKK